MLGSSDDVAPQNSAATERHRRLIAAAQQQYEEARRSDVRIGGGNLGRARDARRSAKPPPDDFIPGYELHEEIHRGAQGVVYRAVQKSTGRGVALKIMHAGPLAGAGHRMRFEREVQILARLEHPNIVGIIDSGLAAGYAYFVMDYVAGQHLDGYVRAQQLSVDDTLALFAPICAAVGEAHLRGVIHRDLKPSNVRVDAAGQPHILDFGLAKLIAPPPLTASSDVAMTQTGQFVGSLPWAAPEQAAGRPDEVDVRTDVYSLGVMLYQMLTGRFPYALTGSLPEVLGRIERAAPLRPSLAGRRINFEVETVVLKCLAKEPARRYQSAGELARDIGHYLAGEPLEARRDSALYVLRKTLGRHKLASAAALAFIMLLSTSAVVMSVLYHNQTRERQAADAARDVARHEADKAHAIDEFLRNTLGAADPGEEGQNVRVVDVLHKAAAAVEQAFPNQPEVEAGVRDTIGQTFAALGLYPAAAEQLTSALEIRRRVLGTEAAETLDTMTNLGATLWMQGRLAEAEPLMRGVYEVRRQTLGMNATETLEALNGLGTVLQARGRSDEAIAIARQVLAALKEQLGPDRLEVLRAAGNLAFRLDARGDVAEAETLYRQALAGLQRTNAGDDPDTVTTMANLANLLRTEGKLDEAETLARDVLAKRQVLFPPGHALIGDSYQVLGRVYLARNDAVQAEPFLRQALAIHEQALPAGSWRRAATQCDLGVCLTRVGRYEDAQTQLLAAQAALAVSPDDHPARQRVVAGALVALYEAWDRPDEAAAWRARLPATQPAETAAR